MTGRPGWRRSTRRVGIGGSDSHKIECVGKGYTVLPQRVTCETELITLIREKAAIEAGGHSVRQDDEGEAWPDEQDTAILLLVLQQGRSSSEEEEEDAEGQDRKSGGSH